jgi:hypothetical protein
LRDSDGKRRRIGCGNGSGDVQSQTSVTGTGFEDFEARRGRGLVFGPRDRMDVEERYNCRGIVGVDL